MDGTHQCGMLSWLATRKDAASRVFSVSVLHSSQRQTQHEGVGSPISDAKLNNTPATSPMGSSAWAEMILLCLCLAWFSFTGLSWMLDAELR